jgi:hypothetical protein
LPKGLLLMGAALLAINIGLLATYRIVGETKMGWMPDSGRDFVINQFTWLVILPAVLALANFLPHARETGSLEPQRRWLPAGFFALWIIATGVHLYCLNYVYNFAFHLEMIAPVLWVLGWTAYRRAPEFLAVEPGALRQLLAVGSLLTPLIAVSESGTEIFFALTVLNVAIYAMMCLRERDQYFARNLLFASVVMLICGLPGEWIQFLTPTLGRAHYVGAGMTIYLMFHIVRSRNPKMGILGSVIVAVMVASILGQHEAAMHWAVESGLIFLLLHSLRWVDSEHEGARAVRIVAAIIWIIHALVWVRAGAALWMPCIPGGIALAAYLITQLLRGRWDLFILPAASIVTVLSGPGNALIAFLERAPAGLLAVIGSFLLFAFGTAAALTKHRWHRSKGTSV